MNYNRFLNAVSLARQPSLLRVLTEIKLKSPPTMISMATGMPNGELFPFKDAQFTLRDGSKLNFGPDAMKQALQYTATPGLPGLVSWLTDLQQEIHRPPLLTPDDPDHPGRSKVVVTNGSQEGFCRAIEAMVSKGDNVLMENVLYPGTLACVKPIGCNILPVKTDENGMDPESLRQVLSKWSPQDVASNSNNVPRVLQCVPNGGNPTGHTLTLERKQEIYKIAQQYDLIILEDDPYFFLQFEEPRVPSFLSMDTDGRVLRFDSFSKLLSSGIRVGFVTGPAALLQPIIYHMQASVLHCSALSQMLLLNLLTEWGLKGFYKHADTVASFYRGQRDVCLRAAQKHLTGLADWTVPSGGMFLWIRVRGVEDTYRLIMEKAQAQQVLFAPGNAFVAESSLPSSYLRAAYSLATADEMDQAFQRLAVLIKEETRK